MQYSNCKVRYGVVSMLRVRCDTLCYSTLYVRCLRLLRNKPVRHSSASKGKYVEIPFGVIRYTNKGAIRCDT